MGEPTFWAIPVLRIFDLDKAKEFYLDFLGFRIDWEHRFEDGAPIYLQVCRGDLVLHLSEHHGDCCPGGCVYVRTFHLEDFHREITAKGYRFMRPGIEPTPWGSKLMEVTDPFGNRLRFDENPAPLQGDD
jgi:catechol 2,3-dioxygenase-like lactoylglutathione lyase family enzyme